MIIEMSFSTELLPLPGLLKENVFIECSSIVKIALIVTH